MNKRMKCPVCHETYKGAVGLATHTRRKHAPAATIIKKSRLEIKEERHGELYSFIVAKLEDVIHRVAFEHDVPERQLAQGFARYLHRS